MRLRSKSGKRGPGRAAGGEARRVPVVVLALLLLLAACTTVRTAVRSGGRGDGAGVAPRSRVVLMPLDVELGRLNAAGMFEPDADWTDAAREHLRAAVRRRLAARGIELVAYDESALSEETRETGRRLIRLHALVGSAILAHVFEGDALPTKGRRTDWSLGPAVRAIATARGADHALFVHVRDSYTTAGRRVLQLAASALGLFVPVGRTAAFVSLVDLRTGDIVWFETLRSPVGDLRTPGPASKIVDALLADLPMAEERRERTADADEAFCGPHRGAGGDEVLVPYHPALVPPHYRPAADDRLERGLWRLANEAEREISSAPQVIRDPALQAYLERIACRLAPDYCGDFRIHVVRTAEFNASMAPNGMLQIWSGLLLRARDEAQVAAVIGHEIGHYLRRHGLEGFRDRRRRLALLEFLTLGLAAGGASARTVDRVQIAILAGLFAHSRDEEREADAIGIRLMAQAGYDPRAAARVWTQMRAELGRDDRRRNHLFATHPTNAERERVLARHADALCRPGRSYRLGRDAHRRAIAAIRGMLWEDQLDLHQYRRTEWLIDSFIADEGKRPDHLCHKAELHRRRGGPRHEASARRLYREAAALVRSGGSGRAVMPAMCWRGYGHVAWKLGSRDEARAAFRHYLRARPQAPDRAMIVHYLRTGDGRPAGSAAQEGARP